MRIQVRAAVAGDEAAIVALIQELAETIGEASPVTTAYVAEYLGTPGSKVLLAEENGRGIGLLSCSLRPNLYHAGSSALIEELVVAASHRGSGAGHAMMTALLQDLEAQGCAEVSVTTMPENEGAQRFYKSLGLTDEAVFLEKHF